MGVPTQELSLLLGPHEASTVLRARECLGAEEGKPPAPWQSWGPRTLSSKAWTLSCQAASPGQQWSVGGGTWGVSPGQRGKAGCPAAPWPLPSSPYTPFLSSCLTTLPPLPSACWSKLSATPIVQKGKLRPAESRATQATQQGSSRVRTELQPACYSLHHCRPPLHLPPSVRKGEGPDPADPTGEAPEYPPACVGHIQDPAGHVGTKNRAWLGGWTRVLIPALP